MSTTFTLDNIDNIFSAHPDVTRAVFEKWNAQNATKSAFSIDTETKIKLGEKFAEIVDKPHFANAVLNSIRILSREKEGIESFLNPVLCEKLCFLAGLPCRDGYSMDDEKVMNAQKCLVNTMFNSAKMRDIYYAQSFNTDLLIAYISDFDDELRKTTPYEWIRHVDPKNVPDMWFFYLRIAFIATAMSRPLQKEWAHYPKIVEHLSRAILKILPSTKNPPQCDIDRAEEALKVFFNVFCHFQGDIETIEGRHAITACKFLRDIIISENLPFNIVQTAIHAISVPPLPMVTSVLCVHPDAPREAKYDIHDSMLFTEALIGKTEERLTTMFELIDKAAPIAVTSEISDLLGPYFQALAKLCSESKYARRYCRLRVLPPLNAEEVKKRPEEHNTLRGKIARLMTMPSNTKDVAAEFMFIICKRSVPRMIKYLGFGHSAGHLANMGLLGQINTAKHASDSEDSETEEYDQVRDSVNPVTGAVFPTERGSALDGMTEEQKEFEAMKLVDAMNKMMDAGIVKPGTIGEDGKVREVSHVLELIKDAPGPSNDGDSDSD